MEKYPLNSRKCSHKYQVCNLRGFIGDMESLCAPLGNWKFLLEKPLLCFLVSLLWPLLQVFLEICLTLSHSLYCLLTHLLKINRSEVNGYFLKFMTVIVCMIPKTAVANNQSYRWVISRMLFVAKVLLELPLMPTNRQFAWFVIPFQRYLGGAEAQSERLCSSMWEHQWIKVPVTHVSEAVTEVFSS